MDIETTKPTPAAKFTTPDEAIADAGIEHFLAEHHDEIEAKLLQAQASIARGEAVPLEPLDVLLREARVRAKASS